MQQQRFLRILMVALTIVVLSLTLASSTWAAEYKAIYKFKKSGGDGRNPNGQLIFDSAGNLYGVTSWGGQGAGTVFTLTPNPDGSWTERVLYMFKGGEDAQVPGFLFLLFDAAGNLYGTTLYGGAYGAGAAFKLAPNPDGSWNESVIHSFNGTDGNYPVAGLIFDAAGNLYSTTVYGGAYNQGTVFKLTPHPDGSWTESVLHSFSGSDGANLYGGLIFDAAGNLYGTTAEGGTHNKGTVFKLTPNPDGSWTHRLLYSCSGDKGPDWPTARLIFDAAGNLYSTSAHGGVQNAGTVFKLMPNPDGSWSESTIHRFNGTDGTYPYAGLIFDAAGNLYGMAAGGGRDGGNGGEVFKMMPQPDGHWKHITLHAFASDHPERGLAPHGDLAVDSAGNFYAPAQWGGKGYGVVFKITP